jgi:hypothetical protein
MFSYRITALLFTVLTPQWPAQMLASSLVGDDPWPICPGRLMAHMLGVATGQVRDPIPHVVLMKPNNGLMHVISCSGTMTRVTPPSLPCGSQDANPKRAEKTPWEIVTKLPW